MMKTYEKISLKNIYLFFVTLSFIFPFVAQAHHLQGYDINYLVAGQANLAAHTDFRLANPWGLDFDLKGHLVVANNHSNLLTFYTPKGKTLESVIDILIAPTGLEYNHLTNDFKISHGGYLQPAHYLLATETGTILAFNKNSPLSSASIVIDRSAFHAVYKGLTLATTSNQHFLYAADFHNAQIDVFDTHFNFIKSFTDPTLPSGFAPFNICMIQDLLYVSYAKQKGLDSVEDEAGGGHGFINVFSPEGTFIKRLVSQGYLNSPWGIALAPEKFGSFGGALLVGNRGDGHINAYKLRTGEFLGQLTNELGFPLMIESLRSLKFKHVQHNKNFVKQSTTLYFTAGANQENKGLVGFIRPIQHDNEGCHCSLFNQ